MARAGNSTERAAPERAPTHLSPLAIPLFHGSSGSRYIKVQFLTRIESATRVRADTHPSCHSHRGRLALGRARARVERTTHSFNLIRVEAATRASRDVAPAGGGGR